MIVIANSRNSRPTMPPMKSSGMKTAASDSVIDMMVKPTSAAPSSAACMGGFPISRCRTMFSSITIASSTTKPTASVSAISDRLSRLKSSSAITENVPTIAIGSVEARDERRDHVAQEQEDHEHDERERQEQREAHVVHRALDRDRPVVPDVHVHGRRELLLDLRQRLLHRGRHRDRVGPRLALHGQQNRALAVVPARRLVVLDVVEHRPQVAQVDGGAVAVGDDEPAEGGRVGKLPGRLDGERAVPTVEHAGRQRHVLGRTACATWVRSSPREASCAGSSWIRTAYFCAP